MRQLDHFIVGGASAPAARTHKIWNPSTGEVQAEVPLGDAALLDRAVAAAKKVQPEWAATNPQRRARVMFEFKRLVEANKQELAELLASEHGKVVDDAHGDVQRGLEVIEYACGIPQALKGEYSQGAGPGIDVYSMRQPLGIGAGITPFNFPAMIPMWMFGMAIAVGNAFILKPSEQSPSAANKMAHLLHEAGLPAGLFSVVHGDREAVEALIAAPEVKAMSFVGSTPVARSLYEGGTRQGKRIQALGGAKNHAVVLPDADLDNAASTLIGAAFGSAGERCMAISVAVCVGDETADALIERLAPQARAMSIGPGTEPGHDMGALINASQRDKVAGYIEAGASAGAQLIVDGRTHPLVESSPGFFMGATLFDRVTPDMSIYRDEIFGPVLCVVRVASFEDAIALINDHQYGNGTCLFTRDGEAGRRFADQIEVGMVGINVPIPVPVPMFSFTGSRASKLGDLGPYGKQVVQFYTQTKTITERWFDENEVGGPVNTTINLK
ncbi:CoA-acylating methylmalonate-semialdehyde dehydrogenase [Stutzerimonas kunmingensis]|uniref:CoA-acylating methylmalonate-semialdehyde dehydrogenase n=1 Tax=Stutzerimonas kunmingensis TaxID=1211807 RepID=UPI00241E81B5|nr:CoA-acylating methylmalonate-semialdehyde dehydrogenase [Stutzerimonas kunmingensis]